MVFFELWQYGMWEVYWLFRLFSIVWVQWVFNDGRGSVISGGGGGGECECDGGEGWCYNIDDVFVVFREGNCEVY